MRQGFDLHPGSLKQVPQELVVDVVVVLHLGRLHESPEQAWAAIGGGLLQVGIARFDVGA